LTPFKDGLAVISFCHGRPIPLLDHRSEAAALHFRGALLHLGIGVRQLLTCQKQPKICGSLTRPVQIVFFIWTGWQRLRTSSWTGGCRGDNTYSSWALFALRRQTGI